MDKVAVLIPCYNESKTIAKVVTDFQAVLPEAASFMYMTTTPPTARRRSPRLPGLWCAMSTSRARAT